MDQFTYILINPSFTTRTNEPFALCSAEKDINQSIRHFWREMARKSFKMTELGVSNFPMCIFDTMGRRVHSFKLDQILNDNDIVKLKYSELQNSLTSELDIINKLKFKYYYEHLLDNFAIDLDLSYISGNKTICFPQFKRPMLLRN